MERRGRDVLITVDLPEGIADPLAPGALMEDEEELVHFDAVVVKHGCVVTFRTEQFPSKTLAGCDLEYRQWWTPEALDAVRDVNRFWERVFAPPCEEHEICILGYETIDREHGARHAWRSDHLWVCEPCYRRYIVDDHLGVRINV